MAAILPINEVEPLTEGVVDPHAAAGDALHGPSAALSLPREVKRRCGQHGYFFTKQTCSALLVLVGVFAVLVIVCGGVIISTFTNTSDDTDSDTGPRSAELKDDDDDEHSYSMGDFRTFNPLKHPKVKTTPSYPLGHVLLLQKNKTAGAIADAKRDKLIPNGPIIKTTGGSAKGTDTTTCVLPFLYKDKRFYECTTTDAVGLWCTTTVHSRNAPLWGFCECRITMRGTNYAGTTSVSETGKRCMDWTLAPSRHRRHLNLTEARDHCRNPNGRPYGPWCYVNRGKWQYCDIPLCGNTMVTFMGNGGGRNCHFPFIYHGQRHFSCIQRESGLHWCATTQNFDEDAKYGFCDMHVKTHGGTAVGSDNRCMFPFKYRGVTYASCTVVERNTPWCVTSTSPVMQWAYCGMADSPMPKGKRCIFPFTFRGEQYVRCTTEGTTGVLWCSLTDNYDRDLQYQVCEPECLWSECDHLT